MKETHLRAYGKINLGLDVIRKRPDGYHDLDMIMQTVGIYDDVVIKTTGKKGEIKVETDAMVLPNDEGNLAYRAAKLILDEFDIDDGVEIYINKVIPIAGGMAGGSSDCAATLKGLNELFGLGLDEEALKKRGVTLGADVPYCIMGGTALARGIGDQLTRLPSPPDCTVLIAKPPISISTAYIYQNIRPDRLKRHPDINKIVKSIEQGDLSNMAKQLYNVMEEVTAEQNPIINEIKGVMMEHGALNSIMSGSGPTVFGLFDDEEKAKMAAKDIESRNMTEQLYITHFVN